MLLAKFWVFDNKTWPDSTLIFGVNGYNLEFEKLSHFLDLLDFQVLSQQVLSRVVGYYYYHCYYCHDFYHHCYHIIIIFIIVVIIIIINIISIVISMIIVIIFISVMLLTYSDFNSKEKDLFQSVFSAYLNLYCQNYIHVNISSPYDFHGQCVSVQ